MTACLQRDWNLRLMEHPTKANKWRKFIIENAIVLWGQNVCMLAEIAITRHELQCIAVFCPPPNHSFVVVAMKREEKKVNIDQKIIIMIRYDRGVYMMSELHRIIFLLMSQRRYGLKATHYFVVFWKIASCNYVSFFNIGWRIAELLRKYEKEN